MNCPKCQTELLRYGQPQVAMQDVKAQGSLYPVKITVMIYHIFSCPKCGVKVSDFETKDYMPEPEIIKSGANCKHGGNCKKEHKVEDETKNGFDNPDKGKPICPCQDWEPKREPTDGELKADAS